MVASDGEFVHRLCMKHVAGNLDTNTGNNQWVVDRFKVGCTWIWF